jgi:ferredoxin
MSAIRIVSGIFAEVDISKCVGCGKCMKECPASVIILTEVTA